MAEAQAQPEGQQEDQTVADQFKEADNAADPNPQDNQPPSIEELASEQGWMPQDKFKGPAEKWKPAHEFLRAGKDIQERTSRELKEMRQTLETVAKANGAIMADRLKQQHEELSRRYAAAVEKGDPDEAFKLSQDIIAVKEAAAPQKVAPAAETQAWVQKNQRVMNDPLAAQRALQVCDAYAKAGQPIADQLANTEAVLKREFPHLFDDKPAPQVNGNISRNAAPPPKGAQTAANLPKEAREQAKDLVERGLIANEDAYAKHYFAAQAKRA